MTSTTQAVGGANSRVPCWKKHKQVPRLELDSFCTSIIFPQSIREARCLLCRWHIILYRFPELWVLPRVFITDSFVCGCNNVPQVKGELSQCHTNNQKVNGQALNITPRSHPYVLTVKQDQPNNYPISQGSIQEHIQYC